MTDAETIRHLWTHKTQDHPWLTDEDLLIDRGEGVWVWTQDGLVENAEKMGGRLLEGLQSAVGQRPIVGEVRGRGLLVCVDLVEPDGSGRPLDATRVAELDRKAWDRGAIVYARGSVLRLAPPLCITAEEVDRLVAMVVESIEELQRDVAG